LCEIKFIRKPRRSPILFFYNAKCDFHSIKCHTAYNPKLKNIAMLLEPTVQDVFESLTSLKVSLHDQSRQKQDIMDYVRSIVYSSELYMQRWKKENKEFVIEILTERADGM
jgi:hypothetical protein